MASTFEAPSNDSLVAYAHPQLQHHAPARAPANIQAIPPERLMPWVHYQTTSEVNNPQNGLLTLPRSANSHLITIEPRSPLNRNAIRDLPATLSAVFPLPSPSLNAYQPPTPALLNPPRESSPLTRWEQQYQQQPRPPSYDNLVRQINTYRNLGDSWNEIANKLGAVGYVGQMTAQEAWKVWKDMQGNERFHWNGVAGVKQGLVEPGEFIEGNHFAKAAK